MYSWFKKFFRAADGSTALKARADQQWEDGKLEDAVASYRQAIAIRADFTEAHNNLGNALRAAGHLQEAALSYREAITLQPRLWLGRERAQQRVLHESPPYACIRCGKAFGTVGAVQAMLQRLQDHPMFQGSALERLKMCGDCRVIDIYGSDDEHKIQ